MYLATAFAVWCAGGWPVRLTSGRRSPVAECAGFVIGGGEDIDVDLYGGELHLVASFDPDRDRLELGILDDAEKRGCPVLGICRGAQIMNVHRGGTLHPDIHEVYRRAPRLRTVRPRKHVALLRGTRIGGMTQRRRLKVNVMHHQAVAALGQGLIRSARDADRMTQAIEDPDADYFLGVQWHPEFLQYLKPQRALFRSLIKAAASVR
jgi:putative glutamine amidotransferase